MEIGVSAAPTGQGFISFADTEQLYFKPLQLDKVLVKMIGRLEVNRRLNSTPTSVTRPVRRAFRERSWGV